MTLSKITATVRARVALVINWAINYIWLFAADPCCYDCFYENGTRFCNASTELDCDEMVCRAKSVPLATVSSDSISTQYFLTLLYQ